LEDETKGFFRNLGYARRSAPLSSYLQITERCNYRCAHCSARFAASGQELGTAQWIRVIKDLQDLGTAYIGITGGEPLLRDDIEQLIAAIDNRSTTVLFTNGSELSLDRAKSLKESGLFSISISLDSSSEQEHNEQRGNPRAFEHALTAIRHARAAGLYTVVQSIICRKALSHANLFELFRLVKRHGAHEIRIHQPAPAGNWLKDLDGDDIFLTEEDRQTLFDIQFQANRSFFQYPKVSSFPYTEGPDKFGCAAGVFHSYVTARGDVTPCDFVPLSFGNMLEESIADIYQKMSRSMGIPKMRCVSMDLTQHLRGKTLPTCPSDSARICRHIQSTEYPRVFREFQELS
jgi:MoaA/NifB/PqqE/SkfB family radical SAM enzyme